MSGKLSHPVTGVTTADPGPQAVGAGSATTEERRSDGSTVNAASLIPLVGSLISHAIVISDLSGGIVWINRAFTLLTGWPLQEVAGLSSAQVLHGPRTDQAAVEHIRRQTSRRLPFQCEIENYRRDGSAFWTSIDAQPIQDDQGSVCGYLSVQSDISRRKYTEAELLKEHRLLRAVGESLTLFVRGRDPQEMFDQLLGKLLDLTGSASGFIGEAKFDGSDRPSFTIYRSSLVRGDEPRPGSGQCRERQEVGSYNLNTLFGDAMLTAEPVISNSPETDHRLSGINRDDTPLNAFLGLPIRKGDAIVGLVGLANRPGGYSDKDVKFIEPLLTTIGELIDARSRDLKRRAAEQSLREAEEWLEETGRVAGVGAWQLDAVTMKVRWSAQARMIHEVDEDFAPDLKSVIAFYSGEARNMIQDAIQRGLDHGIPWDLELPVTTAKNRSRWFRVIGHATLVDGQVTRIFGTIQDTTRLRKARAEKDRLQAQVLLSQKMESVGRLAGGIAHEFNNMLAVILGHSEMLLLDESLSPQQRAQLKAIQAAGQRSADLSHRLLTFAGRQTAVPREIDPNKTVREILDLLRKSIGEAVHLDWLPSRSIWKVLIDPSQLEQILVSLCMNSRDAISGTGHILISIQNESFHQPRQVRSSELEPGDYVILTVSDSGCGIDETALGHLFEPFNSTKPVGEGAGLALATVYGMVEEFGGSIDVTSDPSIGTTFRIYLPRARGMDYGSEQRPDSEGTGIPAKKCETVLLVEDEPALLRLGNLLLRRLGYSVFSARNGREALHLVQSHGRLIDVVISDLVLPELNGWDLARRISRMHPEIRFVFMSGYGEYQEKIHWPGQHGVSVLKKPFSLDRLASAVQSAVRLNDVDQTSATD